MKFQKYFVALTLTLGFISSLFSQTITFNPEYPQPGESVRLTYDTEGGKLEGEDVSAVAYVFDGKEIRASDVDLSVKGTVFKGKFTTSNEAKVVFIKLKGKDSQLVEQNGGKGVAVMIYEQDGKTPVSGAMGEYGKGVFYDSYSVGLEGNDSLAKELFIRELDVYPENKLEYLPAIVQASRTLDNEKVIGWFQEVLDSALKSEKVSEEGLMAALFATMVTRDNEAYATIQQKLLAAYPSGELAFRSEIRKLENMSDPVEMEKFHKELKDQFGETDYYHNFKPRLLETLVSAYVDKESMDKAIQVVNQIENVPYRSYVLNEMAWKLAGGDLDEKGKEIPTALAWSRESLSLTRQMMKDPEAEREVEISPKEHRENLISSYANLADTYALVLYKAGNSDSAFYYQEIARESWGEEDKGINERYTAYMEGALGPEKTKEALETFIRDGNASGIMKKQYKRIIKGDEEANKDFLAFMANLDREAMEEAMEELSKQAIEEKAPAFTVSNLDGIEVSLESLKGKVVVLDFWATWCGPCIMAFPGMDKARKKFLDRDDVIFLFVNSREQDGEEKNNVLTFLEKKSYTFEVLMDTDDKMINAYKVEGIPTKIIIDKEGVIRFKSVGYAGDDEKMVEELSLMIEMAGSES
ncbi:MAG: TlpA disulfide reductase family protein [Bacteroidota bacterium]